MICHIAVTTARQRNGKVKPPVFVAAMELSTVASSGKIAFPTGKSDQGKRSQGETIHLLAMTSINRDEICDGYMPTFKIGGQLYHRVGSSIPAESNETPKFYKSTLSAKAESDDEANIRANYCNKVDVGMWSW